MSKIARFPWYVIFISVYPALFYWAFNATEMSSINGFKLVLFSLLFGLLSWGLFLLLFRNFGKASLATFFALLLFWTYGHLHNYLVTLHPLVFRHAVHMTAWVSPAADRHPLALSKESGCFETRLHPKSGDGVPSDLSTGNQLCHA
jgi:hypothetical protein